MISLFRYASLFIKILNIFLKTNCLPNVLINNCLFQEAFDSSTLLIAVTRAPPSVLDNVNYVISYVRFLFVVLHQRLISNKQHSNSNQISLKGLEEDDYTKFGKDGQTSWSKLINTQNSILVIKLEFRRAPGTNRSGCYRNHNSIAVNTIINYFLSMKSVLINLSVDIQHNL